MQAHLPTLHMGAQGESAAATKGSSWRSCVLGGKQALTLKEMEYLMKSPKGQGKLLPQIDPCAPPFNQPSKSKISQRK